MDAKTTSRRIVVLFFKVEAWAACRSPVVALLTWCAASSKRSQRPLNFLYLFGIARYVGGDARAFIDTAGRFKC